MAITTAITKPLDAGYVQVDSTSKTGYKKYYKVPQKNAGKFAEELKQQDKTLNLYSNITFFAAIFAGVLGATYFTKNMESRMKQFLIQTSAAIVTAALATLGFNNYAVSEENNLLKQHHAKEIFYRA